MMHCSKKIGNTSADCRKIGTGTSEAAFFTRRDVPVPTFLRTKHTAKVLQKSRQALTLMEMVMASAIAVVISLIIAVLLVAQQKNWNKTYTKANEGIEIDALQTMISLGINGRKSNKMNYRLYEVVSDKFTRVQPSSPSNPVEVVSGDAVEFRYWDTELTSGIMDSSITATAYMLVYLVDDKLTADYGPYDPNTNTGGIDTNGYRITGVNVATKTLAEHVTDLEFSHTTRNADGDGDGSIRISITFVDPNDNRTITLKTATLMRNVWGQSP